LEDKNVVDWVCVIRDSANWHPSMDLVSFGFLKRGEFLR